MATMERPTAQSMLHQTKQSIVCCAGDEQSKDLIDLLRSAAETFAAGPCTVQVASVQEGHDDLIRALAIDAWLRIVIVATSGDGQAEGKLLRAAYPSAFLVLWHKNAVEDPALRIDAFQAGYNMVSCFLDDIGTALARIGRMAPTGNAICSWCGLRHLTDDDMWYHQPTWHIYQPNISGNCPCCGQLETNIAVHIHEAHHPGAPQFEQRRPLGAAVVVHRKSDNKFLMVQEFADQGYWVPGGVTDPNESLIISGLRECLEEAGVRVQLKGLVEVSATMGPDNMPDWRLVTFYAELEPNETNHAKTIPDFESAGACWVSVEDLERIPLRSPRIPTTWFPYFAQGGSPKPLELPAKYAHLFTDVTFE